MKYAILLLRYTALCGLLLLYIGCKPERKATVSDWTVAANTNCNVQGYARRLEMPRLDSDNIFNCYTTTEQKKETVTFSIEYDKVKRHAKWVAFTFDRNTAQKNWNRSDWKNDPFKSDPLLDDNICNGHSDHRKDNYDRGHLCASEDRTYAQEANAQTFYYSNISPQLREFNQRGPWLRLENQVREWGGCNDNIAPIGDTLYVVKGGTIRDGEYYDSRGKHGVIVKNYKKMNGIVVPAHYFMALLSYKDNSFIGIAFYIEHKVHKNTTPLVDYAISIDSLEALTGIDFFCNLPDRTEKSVESKCDPAQWGLEEN